MAKKPTKTEKVESTETKAAAAPVNPWGGNQQTVDPSPATSEDAKPEGEVTSEEKDAVTPSGENPSEAVSEQLGDGAEGNGGGNAPTADEDANELDAPDENAPEDETTSIERDKVTPTGKRPEEIHEEAARVQRGLVDMEGRAVPPPGEITSEARDQVTPAGSDISLSFDDQRKVSLVASAYPTANDTLKARIAALSPEDQEELQAQLADLAEDALSRFERNSKAREMTARMVNGNQVFGNTARRPNHDKTLGGLNTNVQLNRRARRAAERLAREGQAKGK